MSFRVGVAGPVGSGKTALVEALCKAMRIKDSSVGILPPSTARRESDYHLKQMYKSF